QTLTFMYSSDANFELGALPAHASQLVSQALGYFAIPSFRCRLCERCPNGRFLLLQLIHVDVALRDEKVGNQVGEPRSARWTELIRGSRLGCPNHLDPSIHMLKVG